MPIVKLRFNSGSKSTLEYVLGEKEENMTVSGNVVSRTAEGIEAEFAAVRNVSPSKNGKEAIHIQQSFTFADSEKFSVDQINNAGYELAEQYFKGHQFIVVTHTNKKHIHNHIVVNPISFETFERIHDKFRHLHKLRDINDEISRKYGFEIPNREAREREIRRPSKVERLEKFGRASYIADLRQKADFARAYATNYHEYGTILQQFGITARIEEQNITYFYPGIERGKRGKNLGRAIRQTWS